MATRHRIKQVEMVGRKLRQLRKERKLTQTELASRIGIQQSDLSRMEKGEYRVSLDTLFLLLGEMRVSVGEFFDELHQESISPRDLQTMRDLSALDDRARREVEDFIAFKQIHGPDETPARTGAGNRAAEGPRRPRLKSVRG